MDATATGDSCALPAIGFLQYFQDLIDPRSEYNSLHNLSDMLVIALLAIMSGADGWVQIQAFGVSKQKWLATFLSLPNGIPSHDTFGRVFSRLHPDSFERCFQAWMAGLSNVSNGRFIAIDGKALRRSFRRAWDKSGMAHLVSAFVRANENQVVFSQLAVEGKSNEITAIAKLLDLLDLKGAVLTIDAIGCQKQVAQKVVEKGGNYVLSVKDNQPTLHAKVKSLMDEAVLESNAKAQTCGYFEEAGEGHGRIETRRVWLMNNVQWLGAELLEQWTGLGSIAVVERVRQNLGDMSGKVSTERHYYISSLTGVDPKSVEAFAGAVRGHWSVENNLHWQLDVSFREDDRRIRVGHGAENFSRLTRLALNLLKKDKSKKVGIQTKRMIAAWDLDYLLQLIGQ